MSILPTGSMFGVVGVTDTQTPSTITGFTTAETNTYIDISPSSTGGIVPIGGTTPGLTINEFTVYCNAIEQQNIVNLNPDQEVLTSSYTQWNILESEGTNGNNALRWRGTWRFNGDQFVRRSDGNRLILGNNQAGDAFRLIIGDDGLIMSAYGTGAFTLQTGGLDPAGSLVQNLTLRGLAVANLKGNFGQHAFAPAQAALAAGTTLPSSVGNTFGYSIRLLNQTLSNVIPVDGAGFVPDQFAMYTNMDARPILIGGRAAGTPFSGVTGNRRATINMAQQFSMWMVDPIWTDSVNNDVLLFSISNSNGASSGNPAEIRTFLAHHPVFQDDVALTTVTDAKIRYAAEFRAFPETYLATDAPAIVSGDGLVTAVDYNGFLVEDTRVLINPANDAARDPLVLPSISEPSSKVYNLRSYTHDLVYDNVLEPRQADITGIDTITEEVVAVPNVTDYLNGHTNIMTAPDTITDLANLYPNLREVWYNEVDLPGAFAITTAGPSFTFTRPVEFSLTAGSEYNLTGYVVNIAQTALTLTGENNTFIFGTQAVAWGTATLPVGIIVSGGTHTGLGDLTGISWTAQGTLNILIDENSNVNVDAEFYVGQHTGPVILSNTGTGTVTVNNVRDGFTAGTNILVSAQATVSNRSTSATQLVTMWDLTSGAVISDVPLATFTGIEAALFTIPTTVTDVRVVWADEGFNPYIEDISRVNGLTTVALVRTATSNAASSSTIIGTSALVITLDVANVATYNIINSETTLTGAATNRLFESAKVSPEFSLTVARQNRIDQIVHPDALRTELPLGTFLLGNNGGGAQQQVTGIRNSDASPIAPTTQILILTGLIRSVIVTAAAGLALGDVIGALDVQTGELRVVVDEELKVGVLTNIGRP